MLNRLAVLFVVAICGVSLANGDDMFLNKAHSSPTSSRYHVKWLTDYTRFPVPFEKQCEAGDEGKYVWKRVSDDLLIRPNQKFDSYMLANGEQKTQLLVTQVHLDNPEELAIYEPIMMTPQTVDQRADQHRDLYTFAYLKSHSILVNKTKEVVNVTCVADFMVPNGFNEDINDGFLAKMEKNAIFKMTMNALNSVKKEKGDFEQPIMTSTAMPTTTTGQSTTTPRSQFVQVDGDLEREKNEGDDFVKAHLKSLLEDLHRNHHPEKLNRDPSFSQTWSHIQRSNPRTNNQQINRPKIQSQEPIEIPQLTNQLFQVQKKVQDKLMMLQNGAPQMPNPLMKSLNPEPIMINQMQRIPNMAIIRPNIPIRPPQVSSIPFAIPFGMQMQMPMFAFMNKRKRFIRQADPAAQPDETSDASEVTSQVIPEAGKNPMTPEPVQHIRLKYGPITLYRPLRQAEIITCNLKLVNHDDMKIDYQSTIFATVRKDTIDKKSKTMMEPIKTNPQYEVDDEAKWAKELNDITNTLKKKIQLGMPTEEEVVSTPRPEIESTTSESKLDQYEAELNEQKPESVPGPKMRMQAEAIKKAPASSAGRSYSIDIGLFMISLVVYYLSAF